MSAAKTKRLIIAVLTGLAVAFLTWVLIGGHAPILVQSELLGIAMAILLLPGTITTLMVSDNVHNFETWIVVVANFLFYFGMVYLISVGHERWKAHRR